MSEEKIVPNWESNPQDYLTNEDGSFVLKVDGTPRKRSGRPKGSKSQYNHHSETKAKMKVRRSIAKDKRDLKKMQAKIGGKRHRAKRKKELAKKLDGKLGIVTKKSAIIIETDLDLLPPSVKLQIMESRAKIAFQPHPGPQTAFLAAGEDDVLYGGAAGGGKSYAMLVDPLRYADEHDHKALILRRTLKELDELMDKARELYPIAFPGAKWKEAKKTWEFPSGAKVIFGYLERDGDVYQYVGQAYSWIGFDELTHLPTPFAWDFLRSRLRTTNPNIKCYMRATTNPGGPGHQWVKERYIDPVAPGVTQWQTYVDSNGEIHKLSRKFIPAKLSDNPSLALGGQYETMLMSLDPIYRERLLNGDWDVNEGAAFPEFDKGLHVIPPFKIPGDWARFKAIDYGHRAFACCLWLAMDPTDGTLIVYRELYQKGLTGTMLGERMKELEADDPCVVPGVLDTATWNQVGSSGPTVGEEIVRTGHKLRKSDKNRVAGKIQVHERLRLAEHTGRPKIQFFNNCTNIIKQLIGIPLDPNNKEDVDTKAEDHAYDALRYGVMSRPRIRDPFSQMLDFKRQVPRPFDEIFGY